MNNKIVHANCKIDTCRMEYDRYANEIRESAYDRIAIEIGRKMLKENLIFISEDHESDPYGRYINISGTVVLADYPDNQGGLTYEWCDWFYDDSDEPINLFIEKCWIRVSSSEYPYNS